MATWPEPVMPAKGSDEWATTPFNLAVPSRVPVIMPFGLREGIQKFLRR